MKLYHFINREYGLAAVRDQKIKLSTFDNLNDPFELFASDLADKKIRDVFFDYKKSMAESVGLLCCSKSWATPLLWSHYADRHRGVALELEVPDHVPTHVEYTKDRIPISEQDIMRIAPKFDGSGIGGRLLAAKCKDWAYEDEARIQFKIGKPDPITGLHFFHFNHEIRLAGLILGPLCEIGEDEVAQHLPSGMKINLIRSRLAFRSFSVVRNKLFNEQLVVGKA